MNRNPKHAPPGEELKKAKAAMFLKVDRKSAKDCSVCRRSETKGKGFVCKLAYIVMHAPTCPDFKDARLPSVLVPHIVELR